MQVKRWAAGLLFVGALAVVGGPMTSASVPCVPEPVDPADFVVDGELDLAAYLAAVAAANAACAPTGLPGTGVDNSTMVPVAIGLVALGGAALATSAVRRRPTGES